MSTQQKLEEEFFTCVICHELFRNPVTLQCNHHFCQDCLTEYTQTRADAVAAGVLPCASCRQQTKVPDPRKPVTEWAAQLKSGFFVQGLMDAIMTSTLTSETGKDTKNVAAPALVMCRVHSGKTLELYCVDCRQVICSLCSGIEHRACIQVVTTEDGAAVAESELDGRAKTIQENIQVLRSRIEKKRNSIKQIKSSCDEVEGSIDKVCQAVVRKILEEAKCLKEKLKTIKDTEVCGIVESVRLLELELRIQQTLENETKKVCQASIIDRINACNMLSSVESVVDKDPVEPEQRAAFEGRGQQLVAAIGSIGVGYIQMKHGQPEDMGGQNTELVLTDRFDIRLPQDTSEPFIRDVLADSIDGMDLVVIADSGNISVKRFLPGSSSQFLPLPARPCKMARINSDVSAVTLDNKSILLFTFHTTLSSYRLFSTKKKYYGITALGKSTLAVSSMSPPSVDVIDHSGSVLRTVSEHHRAGMLFWRCLTPVFLCTTPSGNIVVSDYSSRLVTVLREVDLGVIHTYPSSASSQDTLKNPLGVTSSDNDIYVVDREQESVVQLSSEALYPRNILTPKNELEGATCIFAKGDKVFIAVENRVVKTFELRRET